MRESPRPATVVMYREMVCLTDLQARGWTESLIEQLLGPPHATKRNPHSARWSRMKLWRSEVVAIFEKTPRFIAHQTRLRILNESGRTGHVTRALQRARRAADAQQRTTAEVRAAIVDLERQLAQLREIEEQ